MKKILLLLFFCVLLMPAFASARVGVGVRRGMIEISGELKPGKSYALPILPVYNNGDKKTSYEVSVEYSDTTPGLHPDRAWFKFEPQTFELKPGGIEIVETTLLLPLDAKPGDYFAYLEAHSASKQLVGGEVQAAAAAATKLYFTVGSINIFVMWYHKLLIWYNLYHPYDTIALGILALLYSARLLGIKLNFKRFKFKM